MKREAFAVVGNPLMMGGPVLFSRAGGGSPSAPPAYDFEVREIVEGRGFVFDPSDFATLLNSTGGPVTGPALIGRINGKWGAGTENLSLQSPFPSLTAESDLSFLNGLGFANFNFRGGDAYCVTLGFRVPRLTNTLLYRRERSSGNETLDVFLNPDGSLAVLIAGADQQRSSSVTILTTDKVKPGEFFSVTVIAHYAANTAEVWLNGVSQGTDTFSSAAGPAISVTQTWVVLYSIAETLFRRVVEYAGLPTADERDLFERWVTQAAGVGQLPENTMVPGVNGTVAGYELEGPVGAFNPAMVEGTEFAYIIAYEDGPPEDRQRVEIAFTTFDQLNGRTSFSVTVPGLSPTPITVTWVPNFSAYVGSAPGLFAYLTAKAGTAIPFIITLPSLPLDQQVEAIIGNSVGFAFDPMDFSTVLTTGNVPATALGQPILRQNSKWGSAPVFFSGGGTRPTLAEQGLVYPVSATVNPTTNGDTVVRGFFRNRAAVFICQAIQPPRRPAARAQIIAASQVSGALGRMTLHTDNDLSVTFNYRRTDLGDGAGMVELPPDTLTPGRRSVISCAVDFVNGGASIWKDGVLGQSSAVPAAGGNLEDTLPARVRWGSFVAGGVNEFFEGATGRGVYLPFIPTAQQQAVIEAWVAEPAEVPVAIVANPTLTERVQAILRQTKGFALDTQDLTLMWQDDEGITPVTAVGQPVGTIRSKFGNTSYTYRATDPIVTTYEGGVISFAGADGGLINPNDGFSGGNTGMLVVARVSPAAGQQVNAPILSFLGVAGGARLALEVQPDLRPSFVVARPDANELRITGATAMTPGQAHTLSVRALFLNNPAPVAGYLDGILTASADLTGTPAVTENVPSPYGGLGQFGDTALQFSGYVGRVVCAHFFQTEKDRMAFEEWVSDGP